MPGPPAPVAATRVAVRVALDGLGRPARRPLTVVGSGGEPRESPAPLVLVACSGGADSLALAAATAFVARRQGLRAGAVVVDHGLQTGSGAVAERAAEQCRGLGLEPVEVVRAQVEQTRSGPEADARTARYAVLVDRAGSLGAEALLLGHTRDDQAEQVLLGLARGSGARSLSGMAPRRPALVAGGPEVLVLRPFLGLDRAQTAAVCEALELEPWQDPHNADPRYTRVRARESVRLLEDRLGPGVLGGLARSAELLRDDADALDEVTRTAYLGLGDLPWAAERLLPLPRAVRTRLWRSAALAAGSPGTDLTAEHLWSVDSLVTDWRGQGPLHLPGGVRVGRGPQGLWFASAGADARGDRAQWPRSDGGG